MIRDRSPAPGADPNPSPTTARERLVVFDTTLRDGEQAPGCSMTLPEKLQVARALVRLRVDVLEAGFPAASLGDFEAVQAIAGLDHGETTIAGLARCRPSDIERTDAALRPAARRRIHVFLATSPIHRRHKLRMSQQEVLQAIRDGVSCARALCDDVEFSAEDAARTEREFLAAAVETAVEAGATTINVPDTVGHTEPAEIGALFEFLRRTVRGIDGAVLSAHCHDDLGLALANSLAAVRAGARQVECTINGIGERAGNCALEELVMAVRHRADRFGVDTGLATELLCPTSRLVSAVIGVPVPPNKAIVGANAFAHEAGIHQHGVLQDASTYEIIDPRQVGAGASRMVLGKHSGRHAVRDRLAVLGLPVDDDAFEPLFTAFKELADRKKEVHDADLEALALGGARADGPWRLLALSATAGTDATAHAAVRMVHDAGEERAEAAVGDGPIDAAFRAICRCVAVGDVTLADLDVRSVSLGEDAQGRVTVTCTRGDHSVRGHGASTDVVEATARAIVDAVNRLDVPAQALPRGVAALGEGA